MNRIKSMIIVVVLLAVSDAPELLARGFGGRGPAYQAYQRRGGAEHWDLVYGSQQSGAMTVNSRGQVVPYNSPAQQRGDRSGNRRPVARRERARRNMHHGTLAGDGGAGHFNAHAEPHEHKQAVHRRRALRPWSPGVRRARGRAVRRSFASYHLFTPEWYKAHSRAWFYAGWAARDAWAWATWDDVTGWYALDGDPVDYDYGETIIYQDDRVLVDHQEVASASDYYDQAVKLAQRGAQADEQGETWHALGVFGMIQRDQKAAAMFFQLALSEKGLIRGTYATSLSGDAVAVQGAVDPHTQRVAWTATGKDAAVYETGMTNLTGDEGPILVHLDADNTQDWLLVHLKHDEPAE